MPVEFVDDFPSDYRMLFGARKLGAIVRNGRQSTDGQDGIGAQARERCSG
jgi:hypothetical protein